MKTSLRNDKSYQDVFNEATVAIKDMKGMLKRAYMNKIEIFRTIITHEMRANHFVERSS